MCLTQAAVFFSPPSCPVIWALRVCVRPWASRFSRLSLSSAHHHLFCLYSLQALLRIVFPFLALAAEMPGTLVASFLQEGCCLLLFAALFATLYRSCIQAHSARPCFQLAFGCAGRWQGLGKTPLERCSVGYIIFVLADTRML